MMHGKVGILLLAALAYMTETVLLPSMMAVEPQGQSCQAAGMKKTPGCCHRSKEAAGKCDPAAMTDVTKCCKTVAGNAKKEGDHNRKCDPRDCNNTANCINCPLCFSATLTPSLETGIPSILCKPNYPALPAAPISGYYSKCWKPPNPGPSSQDRILI
jgi:hypothetical protein